MTSELTIVTYHYVRPIKNSEFPGIKGLELEAFKRQLDFLLNNYSIISTEQVISKVVQNKSIPKKACWLTFDDGYKDHYKYVLPELLKRNISAAFFPPKVATQQKKVLDVNLIHYILSCVQEIDKLILDLKKLCIDHGITKKEINYYYNKYAIANRFDLADTIFFKRMLQHVLPKQIKQKVLLLLFEKYVGINEAELSTKIYMSLDEVKNLVSSGMYVGSHGSMHYWLDKINYQSQKKDIKSSLNFLEEVGAPTSNWIMCFPYGAYNENTLSLLKDLGASIGLTTIPRIANLETDNPLTLPRLDTNDFKQ